MRANVGGPGQRAPLAIFSRHQKRVAALLRWPRRSILLLGIVGNLAIIALYVMTRTLGIPFFGPHAGEVEAVGIIDLASKVLELALVIVLVALLRTGRRSHVLTWG